MREQFKELAGMLENAYSADKHLPGKHDQDTHGAWAMGTPDGGKREPGAMTVDAPPGVDMATAAMPGQSASREDIIQHIMEINPPVQVSSGKMTSQEWADSYLSEEPGGYVLIDVDPRVLTSPADPLGEKVTGIVQAGNPLLPVVVDSNTKIEARFIGGEYGRNFGRQADTVIDGKHRVAAAIQRGDETIRAYVPVRNADAIVKRSNSSRRAVEVARYLESYAERKGYPIMDRRADGGMIVTRDGVRREYTVRDAQVIAKNIGYVWKFNPGA